MQSPGTALPLSCPRCETRAGDWCCWELIDLRDRIARGETMRQLEAAFPGKSAGALREAARRYGLGKIRPGIRTRRPRCKVCRTAFEKAEAGQALCLVCDPPATAKAAA